MTWPEAFVKVGELAAIAAIVALAYAAIWSSSR